MALSRFCFDDPNVPRHQSVAANRVYSREDEARFLEKRFPLALAALFAAGDSKHVEVAHQVAFQSRICMRDERRKDEFNDQQTAVLRNDRAAVPENRYRVPVLTAVQDMLEDVDIRAGRNRLHEVRGNEFASGVGIFRRKARSGCIDAGFVVHKHASQMRVEAEDCENERPAAAAEVGDHHSAREIPCLCDGSVVLSRSRAHDRTKD